MSAAEFAIIGATAAVPSTIPRKILHRDIQWPSTGFVLNDWTDMERDMKASDPLVECLEREGVEHNFGVAGEENPDPLDALSRSSSRPVLTRLEQPAGFMAATCHRPTGSLAYISPPWARCNPSADGRGLGLDPLEAKADGFRRFRAGIR